MKGSLGTTLLGLSLLAAAGSVSAATVTNVDTSANFGTLQAAIDDAATLDGHTIEVDGSDTIALTEHVVVTKELTIQGVNGAELTGDGTSPAVPALIDVQANNVTIDGLSLVLDLPNTSGAIRMWQLPSNPLDNVTITNNTITRTGSGGDVNNVTVFGYCCGYEESVGIMIDSRRGGNGPIDATISGNTIGSAADPMSMSGIWIEQGYGTITNNVVYAESFAWINRFAPAGFDILIDGNEFYGWGDERNRGALVELGDPGANSRIIFSNNRVEALAGLSPKNNFIHRRNMQLKNVYSERQIYVTDNEIIARNTGLAITNVRGAVVRGNTITAAENDTLLVEINNHIYSSGNTFANIPINSPSLLSTNLSAGGFTGVTGVALRNHSQENSAGGAGTVEFVRTRLGGPGNLANVFDADIDTFIEVDNRSGSTSTLATTPTDIYGNQTANGEAALSVATMAPFDKDFWAGDNLFDVGSGPALPADMNTTDLQALEAKIQDFLDDPNTALAVLGITIDSDNSGTDDATEAGLNLAGNSDSDIFSNFEEFLYETDPLVDNADADNDFLPDSIDPNTAEVDSDGDGFADYYEILLGYNEDDVTNFPTLGDADNSGGQPDVNDGLAILRFFLGLPNSVTALDNADVNLDGNVDNIDGVLVLNRVIGNITLLPYPLESGRQ